MEKYQMNRMYGRPYQSTCGMNRSQTTEPAMSRQNNREQCGCEESCGCRMPGVSPADGAIYRQTEGMPPAMAYVPCQKFSESFDPCRALYAGTIFPELCKPFCGKRGAKR